MRLEMDGYERESEIQAAGPMKGKRSEQEMGASAPMSAASTVSSAFYIAADGKRNSVIQGEKCAGEWQDMMTIPDEHTITQLVAAVCGPEADVDDHMHQQDNIFLSNALQAGEVADWASESDASCSSDTLSEAGDHKSMSNLPTPPRDRESESPDSDHTLVALDDCDTAMSLCQFLTQENEAIGKLIDQLHSPPATPVSSASSTQPPAYMPIKQEASSPTTRNVPAVYFLPSPGTPFFYVGSMTSGNASTPAITTKHEIEVKTEAISPVVRGSQDKGRTAYTYKQPRSGAPLLWQFLLNLLESELASSLITWTNRCALEFKILDPSEVAKRWGKIKNRPAMNYEKLSRSLRGYYLKGIMEKVVGEQYAYRYKCHPDILCVSAGINETPKLYPLV